MAARLYAVAPVAPAEPVGATGGARLYAVAPTAPALVTGSAARIYWVDETGATGRVRIAQAEPGQPLRFFDGDPA